MASSSSRLAAPFRLPSLPAPPRARAFLAEHRIPGVRVARIAGLTPATVSKFLCGSIRPTTSTAVRLAHAFSELGLEVRNGH